MIADDRFSANVGNSRVMPPPLIAQPCSALFGPRKRNGWRFDLGLSLMDKWAQEGEGLFYRIDDTCMLFTNIAWKGS